MNHIDRLKQQLERHPDALLLRNFVATLVDEGMDANAILADLDQLRSEFRLSGNEQREDIVTDVMDFLAGWCSPTMRIGQKLTP
jgi:hypothetical protein